VPGLRVSPPAAAESSWRAAAAPWQGAKALSRRERTFRAALLAYVQTALALAAGFWVTRLLVHRLGEEAYALYVATTSLAGWASLADVGLLAILPWLISESSAEDGKLARLLGATSRAMAVCTALYAAAAFGLWAYGPGLLDFTAERADAARAALALTLGVGAVAFPLRFPGAVLAGLQDVSFVGAVAIVQVLGTSALTAALLLGGYGLQGALWGAALPPVLVGMASAFRAVQLLRARNVGPAAPTREETRQLLRSSGSAFLSTAGWQVTTSAPALALSRAGRLDDVAHLAVTSRLPLLLMQQAWTVPDAALVGLAQLKGEGLRSRARSVVAALLQFQAVVGVGVTAFVLALNPAFVRAWVGEGRYAGDGVNAALGLYVALQCAVHALVTPASVMGNRVLIGVATFLGGALALGSALPLAQLGPAAVLVGGAAGALLSTVPAGALALRAALRDADAAPGGTRHWLQRAMPRLVAILGLAWPVQAALARAPGLFPLLAAGTLCAVAFAWLTRPLWEGLPLTERQRAVLRRVKLVT